MKRLILTLSALTLSLAGAACKDDNPGKNHPDLVASALPQFEACPTQLPDGGTVADVYPAIKKLTIRNDGKATAKLGLIFSGPGADLFSVEGTAPAEVPALDSVELSLRFSPKQGTALNAELELDDGDADTKNAKVTLSGTGVITGPEGTLGAQATLAADLECSETDISSECTATHRVKRCDLDTSLNCQMTFPDTQVNSASTMKVKLSNLGCPALKITGLSIQELSTTPVGSFVVSTPTIPPTEASPVLLTQADGTLATEIVLTFNAIDDGSGANDQYPFAVLRVTTNDPNHPTVDINIEGKATKPSIYVQPTACNFTDPNALCGNATHPTGTETAKFRITNDGSTMATITAVKFRSSGTATRADGRFTLANDLVNTTIAPSANAILEVAQVDQPLLVQDIIDVESTAGNIAVSVISGIKPCLTTDPAQVLDFGNQTEEFGTKAITIKNGAGCGALVLGQLSLDSTAFYALKAPLLAPGTQVAPGAEVTANIEYHRPPSGGQQLATLKIPSNDTDFAADGKQVILQSNAPTDLSPMAALTGCKPADLLTDPDCAAGTSGTLVVHNNMIDPHEITISGANSTDDGTITKYRFILQGGPSGIPPGATLQNNGQQITSNKTKLVLDPGAGGGTTWRIILQVWDDRNQQSPTAATLNVVVY